MELSINVNSKSEPLVTFLIPTYNRADLLQKCLESIFSQTYKNIEIIVIDDASKDNTESLINSQFKTVKFYKNEVNRGVAYSRNLGLNHAIGKYIGLLDSDDFLLEPDYVRMAVKILESNPEVCVFTCDVYCVNLEGKKICEKTFFQITVDHRNIDLHSGIKDFDYIFCHGVHSCGAIFKKYITNEVGFLNTDYKIAWDEDFFLRLSVSKPKAIYYYNEPLTGYRLHPGNISNNSSRLYLERIKCRRDILRKNKVVKKELGYRANKRLAEQYLCLIDAYIKEKNLKAAFRTILKSVFVYPLILTRLLQHGLSFLNKRIGLKRYRF